MGDEASPFLAIDPEKWVGSNELAFAVRDRYPVSPGHTLVIPRRPVPDWWSTTPQERTALLALVEQVTEDLRADLRPDGFNVGLNDGIAAGQTVFHLHVHVIPRYAGDVADPRGGVRHVIPDKGNYLPRVALHDAPHRPLLPALADAFADARIDRAHLAVAFVMVSGLELVEPHLERFLDRPGTSARLLTTDYLGATEQGALARLLVRTEEYGERLQVRVYGATGTSFHPKGYLFTSATDPLVAYGFVGSANLTRSGLRDGVEWTMATTHSPDLPVMLERYDALWHDPRSMDLTAELVADYRQAPRPAGSEVIVVGPQSQPVTPTAIQREALDALEQTRTAGFGAGLVVMATGLGKTWLAAFDTARPAYRRVLFLAHREEILTQTRDVFRRVRPDTQIGFVMGDRDERDSDVVLATVQTLSRRIDSFDPEAYDYVVVDEFHHAAAASYRMVLARLRPLFLLGLTATPDRADGADLLSLCEDNLVYEGSLTMGIERNALVPFHYAGVPDPVDFRTLPWRNGRFDPDDLEYAVVTQERADAAWREWESRRGSRTLAFCVSRRHADWMAKDFRQRGVRAAAVHTGDASAPRHEAIDALRAGDLDVVFAVDLFNEGLDIPEIDTVLLLRPTSSVVLFLQQLGRGLRLAEGKERLQVVDFVGNHRSFLVASRVLLGLGGNAVTDDHLRAALRDGSFALPPGCQVDYALEAKESLLAQLRFTRGSALKAFVTSWTEEHGVRPTAAQAYHAGFNPAAAPDSWFGLLAAAELLSDDEARVWERHGEVLRDVAATSMTKSYKMVALRALVQLGIAEPAAVSELSERSRWLILRDPRLVEDVRSREIADPAGVSSARWTAYWRQWPLSHLTTGGQFRLDGARFRLTMLPGRGDSDVLAALVDELADWRLARYLDGKRILSGYRLRVTHASNRPILMFDRKSAPGIPQGRGILVDVGDGSLLMDFMKVAVNVARREDSDENVLPTLLIDWFGANAGQSGTLFEVELHSAGDGWHLHRVDPGAAANSIVEAGGGFRLTQGPPS